MKSAGGSILARSTAAGSSASVLRITLWAEVVPRSTTAAGVGPFMPAEMSPSTTCGRLRPPLHPAPRGGARPRLLSAPPEHVRVAALQPDHALSFAGEAHQQGVDLLLRHGVVPGLLAHAVESDIRGEVAGERGRGSRHRGVRGEPSGQLLRRGDPRPDLPGVHGGVKEQVIPPLHLVPGEAEGTDRASETPGGLDPRRPLRPEAALQEPP